MAEGRSRRSRLLAVVMLGLACLVLLGSGSSTAPSVASSSTTDTLAALAAKRTATVAPRPNIVFVLLDDASMNLLPYMPQVQKLQQKGTTFSRYYVTNSLCCPSRASILTGRYPHNTGIYTNMRPDGGFDFFHRNNEESDTFATDLQAVGYRTALMGKYLNQYRPGTRAQPNPIPPGWDEWAVGGMNAYREFNYKLNENGEIRYYGDASEDYLTDVLAERGVDFIEHAVTLRQPFLLELAPFAPHSPYTPAPRDAKKFAGLKSPRTSAYGTHPSNAPTWLATKKPLTKHARKDMDKKFRKRVQSVQAVDLMIGRIKAELVAQGVADNTYLVFSSDNGLHLGEHGLRAGKQTAFDTDIHVPLVVTGPGVPAGRTVDEMAANIDLRPTFVALAGAKKNPSVDGRDLSGLIHGGSADQNRAVVAIEHHGQHTDPKDPDIQSALSGNPPTYTAIRGKDWLYVEYVTGDREYYNTAADPQQLHNIVTTLTFDRLAALHGTLVAVENCSGQASCGSAAGARLVQ